MGLAFTKLLSWIFMGSRETKILMVGLDAAGKTTILFKLKLGQVVTTIATVGFNVEKVKYKSISFTVWDIGGSIRPMWRYYFQDTQGLIFVVDSNDKDRISEARDELHRLMNEDLPHAMNVAELTEKLGLHSLNQRKCGLVDSL